MLSLETITYALITLIDKLFLHVFQIIFLGSTDIISMVYCLTRDCQNVLGLSGFQAHTTPLYMGGSIITVIYSTRDRKICI